MSITFPLLNSLTMPPERKTVPATGGPLSRRPKPIFSKIRKLTARTLTNLIPKFRFVRPDLHPNIF
ncbi:hypothetical protein [Sphingobium subterraneum]|uniref:Uncharacterized protein n=1 Tax=Sphingobium subterraneum TaxID=627688 RepID=A0A841J307_9SPHN|nr:hypothetical protein [Sphingobium subterraneum]MBB6122995.1 hypothetical protein [Sphingobium subterraneum]